jgi:hypothetical protein
MLVGSGVADRDVYLVDFSIGSNVDVTMLAMRHDTVAADEQRMLRRIGKRSHFSLSQVAEQDEPSTALLASAATRHQ